MDHITHEMRLANWKTVIEQCHARPEGQTVKQWLAEHEINEKRYYYWQRRIRKEAYAQLSGNLPAVGCASDLTFAELSFAPHMTGSPTPFKPDAVIRSSKVTIELSNSISDQLLSRILGGLAHAQ
ncbi:MAG: IS66 family insertion sequence element accessory protein TnpB [Parasporobacterium sp.]|nr:IS66 family insertion sequence element accessory protein TnpB [Parasporobacterium sp.]